MNRERVEQLLDHIKTLSDDEVNMSQWFSNVEEFEKWKNGENPKGSCIAGHAISFFKIPYELGFPYKRPMVVAAKYLELNDSDADCLMWQKVSSKGKNAAISRLTHLLENDTMVGYNYDQEV